jgi:hypothetical protein
MHRAGEPNRGRRGWRGFRDGTSPSITRKEEKKLFRGCAFHNCLATFRSIFCFALSSLSANTTARWIMATRPKYSKLRESDDDSFTDKQVQASCSGSETFP